MSTKRKLDDLVEVENNDDDDQHIENKQNAIHVESSGNNTAKSTSLHKLLRHSHVKLDVLGETADETLQREQAYEAIHTTDVLLPSLLDIVYEYFYDSVTCILQRHGLSSEQIYLFGWTVSRLFHYTVKSDIVMKELWIFGRCDIGRHIVHSVARETRTDILSQPTLFQRRCEENSLEAIYEHPVKQPIFEWNEVDLTLTTMT